MTDSQWDSVVRFSPCAAAVDSDEDRALSDRSVVVGGMDSEDPRACVGALGGQEVPLLNMAAWIGTNRARDNPAFSAARARANCAACVTRATETRQLPAARRRDTPPRARP
jgi:hypothetical protein